MLNILKWIAIIAVVWFVLNAAQTRWDNQFKYDGYTAKEWYSEYDWLVACVQSNPYSAGDNCI